MMTKSKGKHENTKKAKTRKKNKCIARYLGSTFMGFAVFVLSFSFVLS